MNINLTREACLSIDDAKQKLYKYLFYRFGDFIGRKVFLELGRLIDMQGLKIE
jgi:hypothetical protein